MNDKPDSTPGILFVLDCDEIGDPIFRLPTRQELEHARRRLIKPQPAQ